MVAAIDNNYYVSFGSKYDQYLKGSVEEVNDFDKSIFDFTPKEKTEADILKEELQEIKDKQGCIQKAWNGIKEFLGIGTSASKCEKTIEKFEKGEISYEEAEAEINKYGTKQDNGLNLVANIVVSVAAIAAGTALTICTGGAAAPLAVAAVGAAAGAITKTGVKLLDRGTNNVKGDDFDGKQMAKDALSGAVTGSIAAATMGNGSAAAGGFKAVVRANVPRCVATGMKAGAISGSANYTIDCAFDDDKQFNLKDLTDATVSNAVVGGVVGGVMGTANGMMKSSGVISHGGKAALNSTGKLVNTSVRDVAANSVSSAEYKILTKTINDIKS